MPGGTENCFFGREKCGDIIPTGVRLNGINSPADLYDALASGLWCADTCAPRMRNEWSSENMTLGQCSVTAFIVQDIFGGQVYGIPLSGGNFHCYNCVGNVCFDLTSGQSGDRAGLLVYDKSNLQSRVQHFARQEKLERYNALKSALERYADGYGGCIEN